MDTALCPPRPTTHTSYSGLGFSKSTEWEMVYTSDQAMAQPCATVLVFVGPLAAGWTIIRPLPVLLEYDQDGSCLLSDDVFYVYGHGATLESAQGDYIASLIEYYEILSEHEDEPTRALFRRLGRYLRPSQ